MEDKRSILIVSLAVLFLIATAIPVAFVATQEKDGGEVVEMITVVIVYDPPEALNEHINEFKAKLESIGGTNVQYDGYQAIWAQIPAGTTHLAVANAVNGIIVGTQLCDSNDSPWTTIGGTVEDYEVGTLLGL